MFLRKQLFFFLFFSCFVRTNVYANGKCFQVAADSNFIRESNLVIADILLVGNKITRPHIITRELIFHQGDSLPRHVLNEAMWRSRLNLLNTSLFNFVDIYDQVDSHDSNLTHVIVRMQERWYLWPLPVFEMVDRNFNEWWLTKDFSRTNFGAYVTRENFRGRKEKLSVLVRLGYSQRLGLYYTVPYINSRQENGLAFGINYTRNHEISYGFQQSKLAFFNDDDEYVRQQFSAGIKFTHRDGIYDYHNFGAEYQDNHISDSLLSVNPDYFLHNAKSQQLLMLSYQYKHDKRDIKYYPLAGHYFDFDVVKQGIGMFNNEPDLIVFTSNYRQYWKLNRKWYAAAGVKGKISGQSFTPYYNQRGLGFGNDLVRGYEYYVIPGKHFVIFKSNLKFTLVPERATQIKFVPTEKFSRIPFAFYLNLFADAGYVYDNQFKNVNPLGNRWLSGYGIGLDYVTYYDIVFRIEYTFNDKGENGLFLHFTAPVF